MSSAASSNSASGSSGSSSSSSLLGLGDSGGDSSSFDNTSVASSSVFLDSEIESTASALTDEDAILLELSGGGYSALNSTTNSLGGYSSPDARSISLADANSLSSVGSGTRRQQQHQSYQSGLGASASGRRHGRVNLAQQQQREAKHQWWVPCERPLRRLRARLKEYYRATALHVRRMHRLTSRDCLPWRTDFAARSRMDFRLRPKDALARLNLNIPYYYSNYLLLTYATVLPFLALYDPLFLAVTGALLLIVYRILLHHYRTGSFGSTARVLGRRVSFRALAHAFTAAYAVLILFRQGLLTILGIAAITGLVVVPHALCRRPTYFDDEDLEKCRPMLVKYAGMMLVLLLAYLEGEITDDEHGESIKAAARERERLMRHIGRGRSSARAA